MKNKKAFKITLIVLSAILIILGTTLICKKITVKEPVKLKSLPLPEITGGERGELGIDKNINESTIDEYLNRPDSVYRDMRMLEDPGNYEAIGGDRFLSGYVKGFEVVPLPYIIPVTGLPEVVGETYTGKTLFSYVDGTYVENYEESMDIIEELFPKDKVIFLMCGGGGYAGMTKQFLVSLGWDENKIYNTGGYWFYKGQNNVEVKKIENGEVKYDFDKVVYHDIDFDKLTEINNNNNNEILVEELKISTSTLTLIENSTYRLNVIALPNEATDKSIRWSSSDDSIATVTDGLVTGKKEGKAIITATSISSNKKISCEVTVIKSEYTERISLDDVSKEAIKFSSYDLNEIHNAFSTLTREEDGDLKEKYKKYTSDDNYTPNDLWYEELNKYEESLEKAKTERKKIMNQLIENKKSFIILLATPACGSRGYSPVLETKKILEENSISYFYIYGGEELTFEESELAFTGYAMGTVIMVNKGKIGAYSDPNIYSFKSDDEMKAWLNNYITVK